MPDGASDDEIRRRQAEVFDEIVPPEPPIDRTPPARPLRDEDALVAIRPAGRTAIGLGKVVDENGESLSVAPGERVRKGHPIAKDEHDAFAEVVPKGLKRTEALIALQTCRHTDGQGNEHVVYEGQWIARDDSLVALNPYAFGLPAPEPPR